MYALEEHRDNYAYFLIKDLSLGSHWEHVLSATSLQEVEAVAIYELNLSSYSIEPYEVPELAVEACF